MSEKSLETPCNIRALLVNLGLQGKKLEFWDDTPFEFGITKMMFVWDYSRGAKLKVALVTTFACKCLRTSYIWDFGITSPFEIGISGLQDPNRALIFHTGKQGECHCQPL